MAAISYRKPRCDPMRAKVRPCSPVIVRKGIEATLNELEEWDSTSRQKFHPNARARAPRQTEVASMKSSPEKKYGEFLWLYKKPGKLDRQSMRYQRRVPVWHQRYRSANLAAKVIPINAWGIAFTAFVAARLPPVVRTSWASPDPTQSSPERPPGTGLRLTG